MKYKYPLIILLAFFCQLSIALEFNCKTDGFDSEYLFSGKAACSEEKSAKESVEIDLNIQDEELTITETFTNQGYSYKTIWFNEKQAG